MPKRPADSELVEIVPLEQFTDWSTDDDAPVRSAAPPGQPPSRRSAIVGGLVALAVIGAAVWLSTTDDAGDSAPTTTTTPTTLPTASTAPPPPTITDRGTGVVISDIPGLEPYLAENPTLPDPDDTQHLVYSDPDSGRFVLIDAERHRGTDAGDVTPRFDGVGRAVDGWVLVSPIGEPARTFVDLQAGEWLLRVHALGIGDDDLVRFLQSLQPRRSGPDFDGRLLPFLQIDRVAAGTSMAALTGVVTDRMVYWSVPTRQLVTVSVGDRAEDGFRAVAPALLVDQVLADDRTWGRLATDPRTALVQWTLPDGRVATATAEMAPEELAALTARARVADANEWEQLVYGLRPDYRLGPFSTVATTSTDAGLAWQAGVQRAERRGNDEWLWWWTVPGEDASVSAPAPTGLAATPTLRTVVYPTVTYVLVTAPLDHGDARLTVEGRGFDEQVSLVRPFADAPFRAGAFAIDQPVPFTVSVSDAGGEFVPVAPAPIPAPSIDLPADSTVVAGVFDGRPDPQPFEVWEDGPDRWFIARVVASGSESPIGQGDLQRRVIGGDEYDLMIDSNGVDEATLDLLDTGADASSGRVGWDVSPFEAGFRPVMFGDSEIEAILGEPLLRMQLRSDDPTDATGLTVGLERLDTAAYQPFAITGLERGQRPDGEGSWVGGTLRFVEGRAILQWTRHGLQFTLISDDGLPALLALLPER